MGEKSKNRRGGPLTFGERVRYLGLRLGLLGLLNMPLAVPPALLSRFSSEVPATAEAFGARAARAGGGRRAGAARRRERGPEREPGAAGAFPRPLRLGLLLRVGDGLGVGVGLGLGAPPTLLRVLGLPVLHVVLEAAPRRDGVVAAVGRVHEAPEAALAPPPPVVAGRLPVQGPDT